MTELLVRGARLLRDRTWVAEDLLCRDGNISLGPAGAAATVVDATGLKVAPGLVDLQCNGGVGIDLASRPEALWELGAALPRWGVTAWLPTIVTSPDGIIERALAALRDGPPVGWRGARPLGLHLEGPFLSAQKRGAHRAALLRSPTLEAVEGWTRAGGVAVVTLAPDLPGAQEMQDALVERGIIVSLGHTPATADCARGAVDRGAGWVTHLFNAMAPLHHREPGLAGVALTDPRVMVGLIADGVHVDPTMVALAQRAIGDRLTLVTDAVATLGLPAADPGAMRLADGTLAGGTIGLDEAVRNLVAFTGCAPGVALAAAAAAPARLLGDVTRGHLDPGARADLVVLTEDLHVVATYVGGELVHDARWSAGPTAARSETPAD